MVVMVLGAISFYQRGVALENEKDARMQADIALSRLLLAQASELQATEPDVSLLLNVEALRRAPATAKDEARFSLLGKLTRPYHVATQLNGHTATVTDVAFSPPDGKLLASVGADEKVRLWDAESRKQRGEPLTGHEGRVSGVAFSPEGKLLASAGHDRTVRLWDVASGKQRGEPLTGHGGFVWGVAFSPDGKLLASASADQTVRLWDVASMDARGQALTGHDHSVNEVAFSPDSKLLASASVDETVGLWDIEVESLIADACRTANRNLTKDEWIRFVGQGKPYARTC